MYKMSSPPGQAELPPVEQVTKSFYKMFSSGLIPVNSYPRFKEFTTALSSREDFVIPTEDEIIDKMGNKADIIHSELKERLGTVTDMCITIDSWITLSNRHSVHYKQVKTGFIVIAGHYLEDWEFKSVLLSTERMDFTPKEPEIIRLFKDTLKELDIDFGKISEIITDNFPHIGTSFNFHGFKNFWFPIILPPQEEDEDDDDDDDFCYAWDEMLEPDTKTSNKWGHLYDNLPGSHNQSFSAAIEDVLKDGFSDNADLDEILTKLYDIAEKISYMSRTRFRINHASEVDREILDYYIKEKMGNVPRWYSLYLMIKSVVLVSEKELTEIHPKAQLSQTERIKLTGLCQVMDLFQELTKGIQGKNSHKAPASMVIPLIRNLKADLRKITLPQITRLVQNLLNSIEARMSVYEARDLFRFAAVLDPRFKTTWCEGVMETETVKAALCQVAMEADPSAGEDDEAEAGQLTPQSKRRRLNQSIDGNQKPSSVNPAELELKAYLEDAHIAEDGCPLAWWEENEGVYPTLASLADRFLGVPASSGLVQLVYQDAKQLVYQDSVDTKHEVFKTLMFVHLNRDKTAFIEDKDQE